MIVHHERPSFDSVRDLLTCAQAWESATKRTLAALANQVVSSPQLFERLQAGRSINMKNWDRLMNFLADPLNWPDSSIPSTVAPLLVGRDPTAGETTRSASKSRAIISRADAQACPA